MGQLVSSSIPNLISGVSQQPQNVRLPTQGEEQVNCFSSVTDFLKRRPAMNSVARLMDAATARGLGSSVFMHPINRDEQEKYLVLIYKDGIKVFDLDGTEKTVTVDESAKAYLAQAQDPMADFRAQTINDYTFIVNRRVTVKADAESLTPKRPPEALVFIKQASYNTTYTVTLGEGEGAVIAEFTTLDGVAPADEPADSLSSKEIADKLTEAINKDGTYQLQAGILKLTAKPDEIYLLENENPYKAKGGHPAHSGREMKMTAMPTEVDLRGMDTVEAICVLERYLDEAMRANLSTVRIIHGKGTGALRAAVQQSLKKNKFIKSFRLGVYGEGEDGVTIAEFR